jgi:hypothetical protein
MVGQFFGISDLFSYCKRYGIGSWHGGPSPQVHRPFIKWESLVLRWMTRILSNEGVWLDLISAVEPWMDGYRRLRLEAALQSAAS